MSISGHFYESVGTWWPGEGNEKVNFLSKDTVHPEITFKHVSEVKLPQNEDPNSFWNFLRKKKKTQQFLQRQTKTQPFLQKRRKDGSVPYNIWGTGIELTKNKSMAQLRDTKQVIGV